MRKLAAQLHMTLDGVVSEPLTWRRPYDNYETRQQVVAGYAAADALLLGRRTYQEFAAADQRSAATRDGDDGLAAYLLHVTKYVVSGSLPRATWHNTTLIRPAAAYSRIAELKRAPGRNIAVSGSVTLVRTLLRTGLLDELGLLVHPLVLGGGRRLFERGLRMPLRLVSVKTLSNGVQHAVYALSARTADTTGMTDATDTTDTTGKTDMTGTTGTADSI